jgi:integrase/recombinase XerD
MPRLYRPVYTKIIPEGAHLFTRNGKRFARFKVKNKTVEGQITAKGDRVRLLSRIWRGEFRDPDGMVHDVRLCTDKEAANQKLAELIRKADRKSARMGDAYDEHHKRALSDHVADFRAYMEGKGNTIHHAKKTCNRVQAVLDGCRFAFIGDLSGSAVVKWLADQRQADKIGIQTSNYYLRDLKGFCRWLVRDRRTGDNPLAHLAGMNAAVEDRLERRALEPEDFALFVEAARTGEPFRGLSGEDRAILYTVGAYTGFRAAELASLDPECFDLAGEVATVTVEAGYSKRRRRDTQPLRSDLAALLRDWLLGKPAQSPLWPGNWVNEAADMVRLDLASATERMQTKNPKARGIPFQDEAGRVFDFHAIRHQFISNLAAAGVHPKIAQALARHSTITLTMDRYTHLGVFDQTAALDKLPALPGTAPRLIESARATGTDGKRSARDQLEKREQSLLNESSACSPACATTDFSCVSMTTADNGRGEREPGHEPRKSLELIGVASDYDPMTTHATTRRPRGGMADTGDLKSPGV